MNPNFYKILCFLEILIHVSIFISSMQRQIEATSTYANADITYMVVKLKKDTRLSIFSGLENLQEEWITDCNCFCPPSLK